MAIKINRVLPLPMPKTCWDCTFVSNQGYCLLLCGLFYTGQNTKENVDVINTRCSDCPLIEVDNDEWFSQMRKERDSKCLE